MAQAVVEAEAFSIVKRPHYGSKKAFDRAWDLFVPLFSSPDKFIQSVKSCIEQNGNHVFADNNGDIIVNCDAWHHIYIFKSMQFNTEKAAKSFSLSGFLSATPKALIEENKEQKDENKENNVLKPVLTDEAFDFRFSKEENFVLKYQLLFPNMMENPTDSQSVAINKLKDLFEWAVKRCGKAKY